MRVVIVEPGKPAYESEIENNLAAMQKVVGGLIEPIYYLDDPDVVMVGNEESKILGMQGNRRFGARIVAGTFFICGEGDEDFTDLTDEQCKKYIAMFANPQEISKEEVENDMGFTITSWFGGGESDD